MFNEFQEILIRYSIKYIIYCYINEWFDLTLFSFRLTCGLALLLLFLMAFLSRPWWGWQHILAYARWSRQALKIRAMLWDLPRFSYVSNTEGLDCGNLATFKQMGCFTWQQQPEQVTAFIALLLCRSYPKPAR